MERAEFREYLEKHLMLFYPERYLPRYIRSVYDMYENRSLLKELPCTDYTLGHLARIVTQHAATNRRFRVLDCLKVIKAIARRTDSRQLSHEVVGLLFQLFRRYVFSDNKDIGQCVSVFIKNMMLDDESITWLVSQYFEQPGCNHILNRLLLYPAPNPLVRAWAEKVYAAWEEHVTEHPELVGRKYQVIALLIDEGVPEGVSEPDGEVVLWGIYSARIPSAVKERLLNEHLSLDLSEPGLKIALRLGYPRVIEHILAKLDQQAIHSS